MATPEFREMITVWAEVAPLLGFGFETHKLRPVRAYLSDTHQRVVVLAQGQNSAPDLILKQSIYGQDLQKFDNGIAAHRRACAVFDGAAGLHVPALVHVNRERQLIVMDAVDGQTAHDLIAADAGDRKAVLKACGLWMRYWHDATFERENRIVPNAVQKFLRGLCEKIETDERPVARKRGFLKCAARVDEMAEIARGQVTKVAATHGDTNLRNFIIGPDGTTGIDFGAIHAAPIGHDLARFVANYANFFYPPDAKMGDGQWFECDLDAFFAGYGADARDDPSFQYLLRMQIIKDWASIPKSAADRNALHRHRWDGIQLLESFMF